MAKSSNQPRNTATRPKPRPTPGNAPKKPAQLPPFHVILLDDNDHTHEYVTEMLRQIFGYDPTKGMKLAKEVDEAGRAIVYTAHRELAELKRELIHGFGADIRVATCKGSMSAIVEQAPA